MDAAWRTLRVKHMNASELWKFEMSKTAHFSKVYEDIDFIDWSKVFIL